MKPICSHKQMIESKIKDYEYYNKLGYANFDSWSDRDLEQFLVYDYFDVYRETKWTKDISMGSFFAGLENHKSKYKKYGLVVDFLDKIFGNLYIAGKNSKKKKILFEEAKYFPLILEAKRNYQVGLFAEGKQDRIFAFKNLIGYLTTNDLDELLISYGRDKNIKHLRDMINKVEEKLRIKKPDYIVLSYDVFPGQRALILVARKLGIPTLVVQRIIHNLPNPMLDFKASEYVLVWGNYFKGVCISKNSREPGDIYILGYPEKIVKKDDPFNKNKFLTLCYLGQDIQRHNKDFLGPKIETINRIFNICRKLNIKFIYRSHYGENRQELEKNLPGIQFSPKNEKLEQTFNNADIFVSFCSTALREAALRSRVSLQLINFPIVTSNFEELGCCSKTFKAIEELETYLSKIAKAQSLDKFKSKFNNDYIETRLDPNKRFLEIIDDIEKRRKC